MARIGWILLFRTVKKTGYSPSAVATKQAEGLLRTMTGYLGWRMLCYFLCLQEVETSFLLQKLEGGYGRGDTYYRTDLTCGTKASLSSFAGKEITRAIQVPTLNCKFTLQQYLKSLGVKDTLSMLGAHGLVFTDTEGLKISSQCLRNTVPKVEAFHG
jgi:hypothetical protein